MEPRPGTISWLLGKLGGSKSPASTTEPAASGPKNSHQAAPSQENHSTEVSGIPFGAPEIRLGEQQIADSIQQIETILTCMRSITTIVDYEQYACAELAHALREYSELVDKRRRPSSNGQEEIDDKNAIRSQCFLSAALFWQSYADMHDKIRLSILGEYMRLNNEAQDFFQLHARLDTRLAGRLPGPNAPNKTTPVHMYMHGARVDNAHGVPVVETAGLGMCPFPLASLPKYSIPTPPVASYLRAYDITKDQMAQIHQEIVDHESHIDTSFSALEENLIKGFIINSTVKGYESLDTAIMQSGQLKGLADLASHLDIDLPMRSFSSSSSDAGLRQPSRSPEPVSSPEKLQEAAETTATLQLEVAKRIIQKAIEDRYRDLEKLNVDGTRAPGYRSMHADQRCTRYAFKPSQNGEPTNTCARSKTNAKGANRGFPRFSGERSASLQHSHDNSIGTSDKTGSTDPTYFSNNSTNPKDSKIGEKRVSTLRDLDSTPLPELDRMLFKLHNLETRLANVDNKPAAIADQKGQLVYDFCGKDTDRNFKRSFAESKPSEGQNPPSGLGDEWINIRRSGFRDSSTLLNNPLEETRPKSHSMVSMDGGSLLKRTGKFQRRESGDYEIIEPISVNSKWHPRDSKQLDQLFIYDNSSKLWDRVHFKHDIPDYGTGPNITSEKSCSEEVTRPQGPAHSLSNGALLHVYSENEQESLRLAYEKAHGLNFKGPTTTRAPLQKLPVDTDSGKKE